MNWLRGKLKFGDTLYLIEIKIFGYINGVKTLKCSSIFLLILTNLPSYAN